MLVNLEFEIIEDQQELLSIICSLIKTSFKCKLDIQIDKENIPAGRTVLPELDFIDLTSDLPRGYYVERDGRQINLTKTDFLRYCEVLLSKKMELSEPKEQLEFLRSVGVSFPSIQKAFDLTDTEFLSLRSDLVFPYVKAKWQQQFSHLRIKTVDDHEAIEAMKKTFGAGTCQHSINFEGKFTGINNIEDLTEKMRELEISRSQLSRATGISMSGLHNFLSGVFRTSDKETIEKLNELLGTKLVYKDKLTPFLEELKSDVDSLSLAEFKVRCSTSGIAPHDVYLALGFWHPTARCNPEIFMANLKKALTGRSPSLVDPADFAECKTSEDFVRICVDKKYSHTALMKAIGISHVTANAIIVHHKPPRRAEVLQKISDFVGHRVERG